MTDWLAGFCSGMALSLVSGLPGFLLHAYRSWRWRRYVESGALDANLRAAMKTLRGEVK